jgi:lysyl endopeptidase
MKRTLLMWALLASATVVSHAQVSNGGLPLSRVSSAIAATEQYVRTSSYPLPDLQKIRLEDAKDALSRDPKPYRTGVLVNTDISFPGSGNITTLADGRRIWRAKIEIAEAPALAFYYDRFRLPSGVRYYITNENGKQILGAYTEQNNAEDGLFASQEVQGGTVNFELDIDPKVNIADISWHINQAAVMYRSVSHLQQYAGNDGPGTGLKPTLDPIAGYSSVCEVNAICPEGQNYAEQRKATLRIIMPVGGGYVGFCTGTLINNTKGDCTPYVLTATHCEENNSKVNSAFSQWIFYFNFEAPDCNGTGVAPNSQTMTGASFIARSDYNANSYAIIGDFLLVQLKSKVPVSYGAYFAGWNRATTLPNNSLYVNFHHPAGDMKKLAITNSVSPNETFNQYNIPNTHWGAFFNVGGNEGGSSGSALFDIDGRIVGDLSGGSNVQYCEADTNSHGDTAVLFGKDAVFSKFSRNWEYPQGNGAQNAQLKPWLDPENTGAITTNSLAAAATCSAPTGITNRNAEFDNSVSVFPNPVTNGIVRVRVNFDKATDISIAVYDITGAKKAVYHVANAHSNEYSFDLGKYAAGTYLISVSNGQVTTSKKVMLIH